MLFERDVDYTIKHSPMPAKFLSPREEFQDKHNILSDLTAGFWRRALDSLLQVALMTFPQGLLHAFLPDGRFSSGSSPE